MEVQVGVVFLSFSLRVDDAVGRDDDDERNEEYKMGRINLLALAQRGWNVELKRTQSAEPHYCILRVPPLVLNHVMYSNIVLRVDVAGTVVMVSNGSVSAAQAIALRLRTLLRACLFHDSPFATPTVTCNEDKCEDDEARGMLSYVVQQMNGCTSSESATDLTQRLAELCRRSEPLDITGHPMASLVTQLGLFKEHGPQVLFFNAVVRPVAHELRQLRLRHRLATRAQRFGHSASGVWNRSLWSRQRHDTKVKLSITSASTVAWLHALLRDHEGSDKDEVLYADRDVAARQRGAEMATAHWQGRTERAYVQAKQRRLRQHLCGYTLQRLTRRAGVQLTLRWRRGVGRMHDETCMDAARATIAPIETQASALTRTTLLAAAMSHSATTPGEVWDNGSVPHPMMPATGLQSAGQEADKDEEATAVRRDLCTSPTDAGSVEEKVQCHIFSTGTTIITASATETLRQVVDYVLLPLLLCCGELT